MIAETTIQKNASLEKMYLGIPVDLICFFFRQVTPDISDFFCTLDLMQNDMASGPGLPGLYTEDPCMAYIYQHLY